jgi:hypothetical protein
MSQTDLDDDAPRRQRRVAVRDLRFAGTVAARGVVVQVRLAHVRVFRIRGAYRHLVVAA